jgi:hypothetical protein
MPGTGDEVGTDATVTVSFDREGLTAWLEIGAGA